MSKERLVGYIPIAGWMRTDLNLTTELMIAYAWIYQHYKLNQNHYFNFGEMIDNMSPWFKSDVEKTIELIEELNRRNVIELDRYLDKKSGHTYAKIKIHERINEK